MGHQSALLTTALLVFGCVAGGERTAPSDLAMGDEGRPSEPDLLTRVTVHPKETTTAFRNPGMGWLVYSFSPLTCGSDAKTCAYAALAQRWEKGTAPDWQPVLESIEISTYGYWGEWHSEITWPVGQQQKTLTTLVDY